MPEVNFDEDVWFDHLNEVPVSVGSDLDLQPGVGRRIGWSGGSGGLEPGTISALLCGWPDWLGGGGGARELAVVG
jgi:hypothetical protein